MLWCQLLVGVHTGVGVVVFAVTVSCDNNDAFRRVALLWPECKRPNWVSNDFENHFQIRSSRVCVESYGSRRRKNSHVAETKINRFLGSEASTHEVAKCKHSSSLRVSVIACQNHFYTVEVYFRNKSAIHRKSVF